MSTFPFSTSTTLPTMNPATHSRPTARLGLVAAAIGLAFSAHAHGQEAAQPESVVIIGSNRANVQELGGASPVDVISAKQLGASGAVTILQALQQLAPSVNFPQGTAVGSEAWNAKAAALGGMNPNYTLVLLNGHRINPNAIVRTQAGYDQGAQAVDLDAIPLSAIERVEVLRDGASAQYGSDAIAGVINIVLRDDDRGGEVSVQTGSYKSGEGRSRNVSGWVATSLPGDGFVNLSVNATNNTAMDSGYEDTRQYYFAGDPREANVNRIVWGSGKPDREILNVVLNAESRIAASTQLYGTATLSRKDSLATLIPLRPADDANVRSIFPDGAPTTTDQRSENYSVTAGARVGNRDAGLWDVSLSHGANNSHRNAYGATNASLGTASPTQFYIGSFDNSLSEAQFSYVRDIATSYAQEPLTVRAGGAYRREVWEEGPGDESGYINGGSVILDGPNAGKPAPSGYPPGNQPLRVSDAGQYSRHVTSLYLDAEQALTERIQAGLAVRAEDYSDFGTNTSAQGNLRFDVTSEFALRASAGSGYRAPSLGQMGLSQTTGQAPSGVGIITQGRVLPVASELARLLGATELTPEKSKSISAGLVWRPSKAAAVTVDAYRRKLTNAIVYSGNLTGSYVTRTLTAAGYPDVAIAQYFSNAVDYTTRGIDIVSRYRLDLQRAGRLNLGLSGHWHDIEIDAVRNNPFLDTAGLTIINRVARNNIEQAAPRSKIVASGDYTLGEFGATLGAARYGTFLVSNLSNAANDQVIGASTMIDLDLRYQLTPAVKVTVGAQNLFDKRVDTLSLANRTVSYTPYPNGPSDPFGRYLYARLTYKF